MIDLEINPSYDSEAFKVNKEGKIIKCESPYLSLMLKLGEDNIKAFVKMYEDNPEIKHENTDDLYMKCYTAINIIKNLKDQGIDKSLKV